VGTARLNNSEAARDFGSMLPLAIEMDDHLRREKTGVIPGALSERTAGSRTYELGDLGYWRPRNTFVTGSSRPAPRESMSCSHKSLRILPSNLMARRLICCAR
jgi:hypothetical protein